MVKVNSIPYPTKPNRAIRTDGSLFHCHPLLVPHEPSPRGPPPSASPAGGGHAWPC